MLCGSSRAGSSKPPSWPCSVGAITSKRGTSSASTGSQQRQVAVKPWMRTSGSPSPARYRAGEISGMASAIVDVQSTADAGRASAAALAERVLDDLAEPLVLPRRVEERLAERAEADLRGIRDRMRLGLGRV